MKNISIIGVGKLGSRHLQGLTTVQTEMNIWVVDQSLDSLMVWKKFIMT
jgi:pyrroline-5-carboxylate reductase